MPKNTIYTSIKKEIIIIIIILNSELKYDLESRGIGLPSTSGDLVSIKS